jgi:hypothetical protein
MRAEAPNPNRHIAVVAHHSETLRPIVPLQPLIKIDTAF